MGTMNISFTDALKSFVDDQVERRGYGSSSEYVEDLIRKDPQRSRLHDVLLEGAASSHRTRAEGRARAARRDARHTGCID